MTMLENLARRVCYALNATGPYATDGKTGLPFRLSGPADLGENDEAWALQQTRCREIARAVLTQLREPSEGMLDSVERKTRVGKATIAMVLSDVIDAVLAEK